MTPATLEALRKRERDLFRHMAGAGSKRKRKDAQETYVKSSAVRKVAAVRALSKLGLTITESNVLEIAECANPFSPCGEPIKVIKLPKPSGGVRTIHSFGPIRRAADFMAARMLRACFAPHADQYAARGRGRHMACEAIAREFNNPKNEWRYAIIGDLKDAYGSIDLEQSCNAGRLPIPFKAFSYLSHPHSFGAKLAGIPQGAAVGSPVLAMILHPVLDQMPHDGKPFNYEDDFAVLCGTEPAAAGIKQALADALHALPGCFAPKFLDVEDVREGFDYLGYRFMTPEPGQVQIGIASKSVQRLWEHAFERANAGAAVDDLRSYVEKWKTAFSLADFDGPISSEISMVPMVAVNSHLRQEGTQGIPMISGHSAGELKGCEQLPE